MKKRITIVLTEELLAKLRQLRINKLKNTESNYSLSQTVQDVLEKNLK